MPYLRFNRDKRGYENTFVVHSDKKGRGGRPRVLYWFRTPPGVKVGRAALDEDAIRMIEAHNPEIDFDWTRILKSQGSEPVERKGQAQQHQQRQRQARGQRTPPPMAAPPAMQEPPQGAAEPEILETPAEESAEENGAEGLELEPEAPATGATAASAAEVKLGSEGLSRLRGRYAEMLARITERITDPERQKELKTLAERLNPDGWVTQEDVLAGLDSYEATFESLRSVVGHRRRRRRRRGAKAPAASAAPLGDQTDEQDDESD